MGGDSVRVTATANDAREVRHAQMHATLAEAKAKEKEARRLRREGKSEDAIEAYEHARNLYSDSGFAFHELGESWPTRSSARSRAVTTAPPTSGTRSQSDPPRSRRAPTASRAINRCVGISTTASSATALPGSGVTTETIDFVV